jgi:hypothetical protein
MDQSEIKNKFKNISNKKYVSFGSRFKDSSFLQTSGYFDLEEKDQNLEKLTDNGILL